MVLIYLVGIHHRHSHLHRLAMRLTRSSRGNRSRSRRRKSRSMAKVGLHGRFVLVNAIRVVVYWPLIEIGRTRFYVMEIYCSMLFISIS